uniref:FHA domain-containing protein n=1 Tax=Actinacidiphila soli TaxID=2487275 RepID=UPI001F0C67E3
MLWPHAFTGNPAEAGEHSTTGRVGGAAGNTAAHPPPSYVSTRPSAAGRGPAAAFRPGPGRPEQKGPRTAMQIRLTVLGPRSGRAARSYDVLVTAPEGTRLGAVAGALASGSGSGQPARASGSTPALYAGADRLDPATAVLGVPPLVDGAVLSLHAPADQHSGPRPGEPSAARLHVVGGPDAGGVHLLQGGQARIGRSADADVALDDPDVSRLHCAVSVDSEGQVTVTDLGSTNGTKVGDRPVGDRPAPLPPGALLRIGESDLRLEPSPPGSPVPPPPASIPAIPDGEGHLRVSLPPTQWPDRVPGAAKPNDSGLFSHGVPGAHDARHPGEPGGLGREPRGGGRTAADGAQAPGEAWISSQGATGGRLGETPAGSDGTDAADLTRIVRFPQPRPARNVAEAISAWARKLAASRTTADAGPMQADYAARLAAEAATLRDRWPDPASILLTALGPGPRLWERSPGHPDALTVRLGTTDLPAEDGFGMLPSVPFTIDLRDPHTYVMGLAGPRPRLSGLARAVLAQLCALHSPTVLEVVLVSADRGRPAEQRADEWSWLNWLPHVRPAHGQDCRLLTALDREQAEARTAELVRRCEEGPLGPGWASADPAAVSAAADRREGPFTLLVVDGDPGSAYLREAVARIAAAGPSVGVHVLCLAESSDLLAVECGVLAVLDGDVATTLRIEPHGPERLTLDAVSTAWAERFARALAPLREGDAAVPRATRTTLPAAARLLDELDLALATPAKVAARWGEAGLAG